MQKNPDDRPRAAELVKHKLCQNAPPNSCLIPYVEEYRQLHDQSNENSNDVFDLQSLLDDKVLFSRIAFFWKSSIFSLILLFVLNLFDTKYFDNNKKTNSKINEAAEAVVPDGWNFGEDENGDESFRNEKSDNNSTKKPKTKTKQKKSQNDDNNVKRKTVVTNDDKKTKGNENNVDEKNRGKKANRNGKTKKDKSTVQRDNDKNDRVAKGEIALQRVVYPALSQMLLVNQNDESTVNALAQLKLAFDDLEKVFPGASHDLIVQMIDQLKNSGK